MFFIVVIITFSVALKGWAGFFTEVKRKIRS